MFSFKKWCWVWWGLVLERKILYLTSMWLQGIPSCSIELIEFCLSCSGFEMCFIQQDCRGDIGIRWQIDAIDARCGLLPYSPYFDGDQHRRRWSWMESRISLSPSLTGHGTLDIHGAIPWLSLTTQNQALGPWERKGMTYRLETSDSTLKPHPWLLIFTSSS